MKPDQRRVCIIGTGKVGTAVAVLLSRAGYPISALWSRRRASAEAAAARSAGRAITDIAEAASTAEIVFITTPDDVVADTCCRIADAGGFQPGSFVFHMSGALATEVLEPAQLAGASVGSIHPMQSFADVEGAVDQLPGSVFGVTARGEATRVAHEIVDALGGRAVDITDEQKAVYHAAACVVSNYLVALADYAEELYETVGIDPALAREAYTPLIHGTRGNLAHRGPEGALTGPIARGDVGTVRAHLRRMTDAGLDTSLYRVLGERTVAIARRRGLADPVAQELLALLRDSEPPDRGRSAETHEERRPR